MAIEHAYSMTSALLPPFLGECPSRSVQVRRGCLIVGHSRFGTEKEMEVQFLGMR